MKLKRLENGYGLLNKIVLFVVLYVFIVSCKQKDSEEFLSDTSWYLKSTVGHFPNKDTMFVNTYWFEKIRRFRGDRVYEKCELMVYSCIICEPHKKFYGDLVYPHINWSVIDDTLITPTYKYKILELTGDSIVLSFKNGNIKYTEVWKRIEI